MFLWVLLHGLWFVLEAIGNKHLGFSKYELQLHDHYVYQYISYFIKLQFSNFLLFKCKQAKSTKRWQWCWSIMLPCLMKHFYCFITINNKYSMPAPYISFISVSFPWYIYPKEGIWVYSIIQYIKTDFYIFIFMIGGTSTGIV